MIQLYKHQKEAYDFAKDRRYAAFFMETGTGKTLTAMEVMKYWARNGREHFLVVVPNTLTGVWIAEAEKWNFPLKIIRLTGSTDQKLKQLKEKADVVVVNYEAFIAPALVHALIAWGPEGMIMDEIQRAKNRRAQRTKMCRELAKVVQENGGCVMGMTGTPVVHSPLDLWSEFDVMMPGATPSSHPLRYGNYQAFEQAVAVVTPHPRLGNRVKLYEYPDDRLQVLKERVAPLAVEASKADCLDLPPRRFSVVELPMEEEQQKLYRALADDYLATLDGVLPGAETVATLATVDLKPLTMNEKAMQMYADIEAADEDGEVYVKADRRISVAFAATLMTRLQQIAAGHVKADDGTVHFIKGCKEEWLVENLPVLTAKGWDHKCVIFCRFIADVELLTKIATDLDIGFVTLDGRNSKDAAKVVAKFQTDPDTRIFIGNVAVASTGITLTAADRVVFYTNSFSWGDRAQAEDRTYRIGQEREVEYIDLAAKGTVDLEVLANLGDKTSLAIKTVQGLRAVLEGLRAA